MFFKLWIIFFNHTFHRQQYSTSVKNKSLFHRWKTAELVLFLLLAAHLSEASYLIFANQKEIRKLDDDDQNVIQTNQSSWIPAANTSVLVDRHLEVTVALDFDYERQIIFWSDAGYETISGLRLATSQTFDVITESIISPDGLAVDWLTKKIYWADSEANRIEVAMYDGSLRSVLFWTDLEQPRALVLVPPEGLLFWCNWGILARIERASMDGEPSSRRLIVHRDIVYPNGLTVDYEARRLYWIEAKGDHISSVDYDGAHQQTVACGYPIHPFAITIDGRSADEGGPLLYWTDISTRDVHRCNLTAGTSHRFNISGSVSENQASQNSYNSNNNNNPHNHNQNPSKHSHHQDHKTTPTGIVLFSSSRQPFTISNSIKNVSSSACLVNNGNCSHLCLLSSKPPHYASCACSTGVRLLPDGRTCPPRPDNVLLIARRTDIRRVSLDTADFTTMTVPLEPSTITPNINAVDDNNEVDEDDQPGAPYITVLDYDPVEERIYWAEEDRRLLMRAFLNGTKVETIVSTELHHPDGVAVDWLGRNLYWTDAGTDRLEVARLDGSARTILLSEGLERPRAIVLHPLEGLLFWSDWGRRPKIERAALDGSGRRVLVGEAIAWPNGLAIDYPTSRLYWCDAKLHTIEAAGLDGTDRQVVFREANTHFFGFTVFEEWAYWSDLQRRSVERVHKKTGEGRQVIVDTLPDMLGIKAVWVGGQKRVDYDPKLDNPCGGSQKNGGCSHLCLKRNRTEAVCVCPVGYELARDRRTCVQSKAYFLVLRKGDIRSVSTTSLETSSMKPTLDVMAVSGVHSATAFDVDVSANTVYWIESSSSRKAIYRSLLNGSSSELVVALEPTAEASPYSLAVDWIAKNVYWSDTGVTALRIEVIRADGSFRRVVVKGGDRLIGEKRGYLWPHSIVVDPTVGYLFWTDWTTTSSSTLNSEDSTIGGGTVERAYLDGEGQLTIASDTGTAWALTADYLNRRLYWLQKTGIDDSKQASFQVVSSSYNGEGGLVVITVESSTGSTPPVSMVTFGDDLLYFLEPIKGVISSLNKTTVSTKGNKTSLITIKTEVIKESPELTTAADLFLYQGGLSQRGWNFCAINNGSCSQLCFARASRPTRAPSIADLVYCSCATHYRLAADGRSCLEPNSFLLFSHRHEVTRFLFESPPPSSKDKRKAQNGGRSGSDHLEEVTVSLEDSSGSSRQNSIKALAYDQLPSTAGADDVEEGEDYNERLFKAYLYQHHHGWIYWIDGKNADTIKRARLNGTKAEVVFEAEESEGQLVDLLIDSPSRLLLWTSAASNAITAGRLVGSLTEETAGVVRPLGAIFYSLTDRPRLLAYHAEKHLLFWSNDLQSATIERLSLTVTGGGMPKTTVIGDRLLEVLALTVDPALHYLVWADRGSSSSIEYSDLEGHDRQVLYSEANIEPIALTTHARYLFWAEGRARRTVEKVPLDLNQGRMKQTLFKRAALITDLIAVQAPPKIWRNSTAANCLEENGGCSHLCVAIYNISSKTSSSIIGRKCACPRGLVLGRDGRRCTEPIRCDAGQRQYACANGIACIDALFRCNGWADCADGSDELHCPKCTTGANKNAEEPSKQQQFTCLQQLDHHQWTGQESGSSLICLEESRLCDGVKDCYGGTDELCCADKFRCNSRHCLTSDQMCDGKKDCADGEDEQAAVCELYTRRQSVMIRSGGGKSTFPSPSTSFTGLSLFLIILSTFLFFIAVFQCKRCLSTATEAKQKQHHLQNQSFLMTERGGGLVRSGDTTSTSTVPSRFTSNRNLHKSTMIKSLLQRQKSSEQTTCNTLTSTTTVLSLRQMAGVAAEAPLLQQISNDQTIHPHSYPYQSSSNQQHLLHHQSPHLNNGCSDHTTSSSSSPAVAYPCETINPPPSPCTERSHSTAYSSALFVPRSRTTKQHQAAPLPSNRNRRKRSRLTKQRHQQSSIALRGPPPTPCGTDVYDDDPDPPPTLQRNHQHQFYTSEEEELDDLLFSYKPPPPTPRHYFSDEEGGGGEGADFSRSGSGVGGCPPSPVTEHSFLGTGPLPPPKPKSSVTQKYEVL